MARRSHPSLDPRAEEIERINRKMAEWQEHYRGTRHEHTLDDLYQRQIRQLERG